MRSTSASQFVGALSRQTQGRYAEAEPLIKHDLAICETALGPDHPSVAVSLSNQAELYRAQGRYTHAEPLYRRALAIYEAVDPNHPDGTWLPPIATAGSGFSGPSFNLRIRRPAARPRHSQVRT